MISERKRKQKTGGILEWIALYVTEINGLEVKRGETVELICRNGDKEMIIVRRNAKDIPAAFLKCLAYAMKRFPKTGRWLPHG